MNFSLHASNHKALVLIITSTMLKVHLAHNFIASGKIKLCKTKYTTCKTQSYAQCTIKNNCNIHLIVITYLNSYADDVVFLPQTSGRDNSYPMT